MVYQVDAGDVTPDLPEMGEGAVMSGPVPPERVSKMPQDVQSKRWQEALAEFEPERIRRRDAQFKRIHGRDYPVRAAGWDEAKHPRDPAGSDTGGQFASKVALMVNIDVDSQWEVAQAILSGEDTEGWPREDSYLAMEMTGSLGVNWEWDGETPVDVATLENGNPAVEMIAVYDPVNRKLRGVATYQRRDDEVLANFFATDGQTRAPAMAIIRHLANVAVKDNKPLLGLPADEKLRAQYLRLGAVSQEDGSVLWSPEVLKRLAAGAPRPVNDLSSESVRHLTSAGFDEAKHPRDPAGTKTGGQFTRAQLNEILAMHQRNLGVAERRRPSKTAGPRGGLADNAAMVERQRERVRKTEEMLAALPPEVQWLETKPSTLGHEGQKRVPWIYDPDVKTLYVGSPGSDHTELSHKVYELHGYEGSLNREWIGVWVPGEGVVLHGNETGDKPSADFPMDPDLPGVVRRAFRSPLKMEDEGTWYDNWDAMSAAGWDEHEHPRHPRGEHLGGKFRRVYEASVESMPDEIDQGMLMEEVGRWPDRFGRDQDAQEYALGAFKLVDSGSPAFLITVRDQNGDLVGVGDFMDIGGEELMGGSFGAIKGGGLPLFNSFLEEAEKRGKGAVWTAGNDRAKALYLKLGIPQQFMPSEEEWIEYGDLYPTYDDYLRDWNQEFGNEFILNAGQVRLLSKDMFALARDRPSATAALVAAGWVESEHPRWPEGHEHGGEFRPKESGTVPLDQAMEDAGLNYKYERQPIKVGQALHFREEYDQWYRSGIEYKNPDDVQAILDNWGNWTVPELYELRKELQRQLSEGGWIVNDDGQKVWASSGLLSGQYANEIGRSLSQARNEAKRLLETVDKQITIHQFGEEGAREHYPELFETKAPKAKAIDPRSQGVPDDYLTEKGTFKPGYDAKLKSDLVNSVVGLTPTVERVTTTSQPVSDATQAKVAEWWKTRNADEQARNTWPDDEHFRVAKHDPLLPYELQSAIRKEENVRVHHDRESTLIHRFDEGEALRILHERGWEKHLASKEAKIGLTPHEPNRQSVVAKEIVDRVWGDNAHISGFRYAEVQTRVQDMSHIPDDIVRQLKKKDVHVYIGPAEKSTDLDQMQDLEAQKGSGRGWRQTNLANVPGWYSPSDRKVMAPVMSRRGGSAAVTTHEIGHAIGHTLGMDLSDRLHEYHHELYNDLAPYFQQGGKGATKGKKEMWAEGVAVATINRKYKSQGIPPTTNSGPFKYGKDTTPKAQEYYAWVDSVLDRLGSARTRYSPEHDGSSVAPYGMHWVHDPITGLNVLEKD